MHRSIACPDIGGVGFFPRELRRLLDPEKVLAWFQNTPVEEIIDVAVVADSDVGLVVPPGPARGRVLAVRREGDRLAYDLDIASPGLFVIADTWFPGWHAHLDATPVPILPVNLAFKGVVLPEAGRHTLELEFSVD